MLLTSSPACPDTTNRGLSRRTYNFVLLYGYINKKLQGSERLRMPKWYWTWYCFNVCMSSWSFPIKAWIPVAFSYFCDYVGFPNRNTEWWRQHTSGDPELRLHPSIPPPPPPTHTHTHTHTHTTYTHTYTRCPSFVIIFWVLIPGISNTSFYHRTSRRPPKSTLLGILRITETEWCNRK